MNPNSGPSLKAMMLQRSAGLMFLVVDDPLQSPLEGQALNLVQLKQKSVINRNVNMNVTEQRVIRLGTGKIHQASHITDKVLIWY